MRTTTIALILTLGSLPALAQAAQTIKLVLEQSLVRTVKQDGKTVEQLIAMPPTVMPGDILVEEVSAHNVTAKASRPTRVTVPVPQGTTYVGNPTPASARWQLNFSFDGGKTFGTEPLKQTVTTTENGREVTREVTVPATRYTHIRWNVTSIAPNETLKFAFRVKVK